MYQGSRVRTASAIDILRMSSDEVLHETAEISVARGDVPSEFRRREIKGGGEERDRKGFGTRDGSVLRLVSGSV
jgi:hypothetical protein